MPFEIQNSVRTRSIVRIVGNTSTHINLSTLSTNTAIETVSAASINHVITSTDGWIRIYRGNNTAAPLVLELYGSNDLPLSQYDISIANTSTANLFVTNSSTTGGTVILSLTKSATYTVDLDTNRAI